MESIHVENNQFDYKNIDLPLVASEGTNYITEGGEFIAQGLNATVDGSYTFKASTSSNHIGSILLCYVVITKDILNSPSYYEVVHPSGERMIYPASIHSNVDRFEFSVLGSNVVNNTLNMEFTLNVDKPVSVRCWIHAMKFI